MSNSDVVDVRMYRQDVVSIKIDITTGKSLRSQCKPIEATAILQDPALLLDMTSFCLDYGHEMIQKFIASCPNATC
ncbi:unnamed protein product, partial [Ceratitis capitata]